MKWTLPIRALTLCVLVPEDKTPCALLPLVVAVSVALLAHVSSTSSTARRPAGVVPICTLSVALSIRFGPA